MIVAPLANNTKKKEYHTVSLKLGEKMEKTMEYQLKLYKFI